MSEKKKVENSPWWITFFLKQSYVSVSWLKLRSKVLHGWEINSKKLTVLFGKRSAALLKFRSPLYPTKCRMLYFIPGIYCRRDILNCFRLYKLQCLQNKCDFKLNSNITPQKCLLKSVLKCNGTEEGQCRQKSVQKDEAGCCHFSLPQLFFFFFCNIQMFLIKATQLSQSCSLLLAVTDSQESISHSSFHDLSNPGL